MKIEISTGCTAFYTLINEERMEDCNMEEVIDQILPKLKQAILVDHTIGFNDLVQLFQYSDYDNDSNPCDQCGDSVSITTWEI